MTDMTPEQRQMTPAATVRKSRKTWWITGGVIAAVALCCAGTLAVSSAARQGFDDALGDHGTGVTVIPSGAASGQPEAPGASASTDARPAVIGDTLRLTSSFLGSRTTVEYTVKDLTVEKSSGDFGAENGQYVLVHVTIRVIEGGTYACSCDFALQGPDGRLYEEAVTFLDDYPTLSGTDLTAGQFVDGWVGFDVPAELATTGKVQLTEDAFTSDQPVYWSVR